MAVVETSINFLKRDELYDREKPYQLKYAAAEGIPISNLRLEKQDKIQITSLRDREAQFSFEKNGFAVLRMDEEIPYDDFGNPDGIHRYLDIVSVRLKKLLGADKVQAFQYVVRARAASLALKRGSRSRYQDPETRSRLPSRRRGQEL